MYREGTDDQYPELSDDRSKGRPSAARSITSIVAGLTVAMSMPPWGFWPLSFVGVAMFELALGTTPTRRQRATYGALFGAAWTYLGMAWMVQLTVPGYLVSGVVYGTFHACAALAVPPGRWEIIGRPAAHTLVEALRFSFPFGGVPLASMGIAQVSGPLAGIARVGGVILITWAVFQVGFVLGALTRDLWHRVRAPQRQPSPPGERAEAAEPHGRSMPPMPSMPSVPSMPSWHTSWRFVVIPLVAVVGLLGVAVVAPRGEATGESMRIAAIQGGGEQGTSAIEVPSILVTERHLETTASIEPDPDLDLVLWPENTVDVLDFESSAIRDLIAAEASRLGVPISVGITEETDDPDRFVNAQVVVGPDGTIVARYDKVRRVPFGEYVPLRGVLEALGAPVDRIGRDALAGTEPAVVRLPDGTPLGVVISWEVFFGGRAREGVREGGLAIVNPTNGASYTGTIVQTQQVASSRLRSIENGRWTVQAAPTGFTAVIDADGAVLERSAISERTVIVTDVELRDGFTWYTNLGDAPIIVVILAVYALAVSLTLRDRRRGELAPAARDGSTD